MKKILLLLMLFAVPAAALAEEQPLGLPHWSLELKSGRFTPSLSNWKENFGRKNMPEYALSLAYKLRRHIEIGVEGGTARATGSAIAKIHSEQAGQPVSAGSVRYEIFPVNAFLLFRGVISDNQAVVPYLGGGITKVLYREAVEGQGSVKGSVNGFHARGGLQFLLDGVDRSAANSMYMDYGVMHTYFFVEAEYISAKINNISADLGGTAYLAGFLFEF